jgi:hypothetical protein
MSEFKIPVRCSVSNVIKYLRNLTSPKLAKGLKAILASDIVTQCCIKWHFYCKECLLLLLLLLLLTAIGLSPCGSSTTLVQTKIKITQQQNNYETVKVSTQTDHKKYKFNTYYKNTHILQNTSGQNNHSTRHTHTKWNSHNTFKHPQ